MILGRIQPPNFFTTVEEKLGITLACCPALRQFFTFVRRTGTVLPSRQRQPPNADFVNFRQRVKLRDIFWYRKPPPNKLPANDRAFVRPEAIRKGGPAADDAEKSPLDVFRGKLISAFGVQPSSRRLRSDDVEAGSSPSFGSRLRGAFAMPSFLNSSHSPSGEIGGETSWPLQEENSHSPLRPPQLSAEKPVGASRPAANAYRPESGTSAISGPTAQNWARVQAISGSNGRPLQPMLGDGLVSGISRPHADSSVKRSVV